MAKTLQAQGVVVSNMKFSWRTVSSGLPRRKYWSQHKFMAVLDGGTECALSKFAYLKLEGVLDTPDSCTPV